MKDNTESNRYEDIIHLPHHVSKRHPRMPMEKRAAQFSPFAALTGHEEAIFEAGRLTESRIELDEHTKAILDATLHEIREKIDGHPEVSVTWFVPDTRKEGGNYLSITGRVRKIDAYEKMVWMDDGRKIPIEDIRWIEVL